MYNICIQKTFGICANIYTLSHTHTYNGDRDRDREREKERNIYVCKVVYFLENKILVPTSVRLPKCLFVRTSFPQRLKEKN